MRRILLALFVLTASLWPASGQEGVRIYQRARVPAKDVLDRLGLVLVWAARVPTEGQRDHLVSVQLLPDRAGDQLLIQTASGLVQMQDATTGDVLWRMPVGRAYQYTVPAAWNRQSIFVNRADRLYVLDRGTGRHRVFDARKVSNLPLFGYLLQQAPSATPVADEAHLYVPANDRVMVYLLPTFQPSHPTLSSLPERGLKKPTDRLEPSLQPEYGWAVRTVDAPVTFPLILTSNQVSLISGNGTMISLNALEPVERYTYKFGGNISDPMGWFEDVAYVGCEDHTLTALQMISRKLLWRYMAGGPVSRRPEATERDVFVTTLKGGLARVDRETGERVWLNREADRFLATNNKFVWAFDYLHRFLVLDYLRGTTLARAAFSDFQMPMSNPDTDRLFLGNHDGLILCLRSRDNVQELRLRPAPDRGAKPPEKKPDEKKPDEKKPEEKKGEPLGWRWQPQRQETTPGRPLVVPEMATADRPRRAVISPAPSAEGAKLG